MEVETSELWRHYCRMYLDRFGHYPTMSLSRDELILAILDLRNERC